MSTTKYDTLYYYTGGTEAGSWHEVLATPEEFERHETELERAGYYSRRGRKAIGPPEGPPAELFQWRKA